MITTFTQRAKIIERMGVSKPSRGEAQRIARLGELDDRHQLYLSQGNRQGLLELAAEYDCLGRHGGMKNTAAMIRYEAERMKG